MDLYAFWNSETKRVGNDFTLMYNKKTNSLQYRNEIATMTVRFNERDKEETFYFHRNNVRNSDNNGLGDIFLKIANSNVQYRNYARAAEVSITDDRIGLPDEFMDLVKTYQSERVKIAIPYDKKSKQQMER